jgi:hypothetical protein
MQNSALVTGGASITAATLVPIVQWLLPTAPESVAILLAAASLAIGHAAINFVRRKLGDSIADLPDVQTVQQKLQTQFPNASALEISELMNEMMPSASLAQPTFKEQ